MPHDFTLTDAEMMDAIRKEHLDPPPFNGGRDWRVMTMDRFIDATLGVAGAFEGEHPQWQQVILAFRGDLNRRFVEITRDYPATQPLPEKEML